ncbi:TetR/AcrR family transcriptional regulator [Polyangium jinanense]|uniref:TetR/AcrR family transcriptional regulator n=1 Tax=Polyangium jinanense TaxID=2829994 RepID=A0A9X3X8F8_9BACT|nr:TetR/AcrR family transcriptional regulator [Polyangium jinanense]MDC3961274.1 TetR/AcrR family transcriptional regulator [Polyangium jinanense]MDC3984093.1 TetR/AcrR family transcriptional regulator [Polyangium jinanense]
MKKEPLSKADRWERTHETLRLTAARLLRTRGLRLPSVADVMKGAKLTVGGFYGHWESKEALFEEALRDALRNNWSELVQESRGETAKERLTWILRRYLSRSHRDNPEAGCPLPATLSDISVLGAPYQKAFAEEVESLAAELGEVAGPIGGKQLALGLFALMVGGLSLARATEGTPLSDAILTASRALAYAALDRAEQKASEKDES